MKLRMLDLAALAIASAILIGSVVSMSITRLDPGVHLGYSNGQVVIESIDYASLASSGFYGLNVGDVVVSLDGMDVIDMTPEEKQGIAQSPWAWSSIGVRMAGASAVASPFDVVSPIGSFAASNDIGWTLDRGDRRGDLGPIILGLTIMGFGWWWLGSGRGGDNLVRFALTLPLATAMPILVLPILRVPSLFAVVSGSVLVAAAMLPLAFDLAGSVPRRLHQFGLTILAVQLAVAAAAIGFLVPLDNQYQTYDRSMLRAILVAAIPLAAGFAAARPMRWLGVEADTPRGRLFA
jgi:hypothetical protein